MVKPPFIRSANNYDTNAVSDETGLKCEDPSLAQQNYRDSCDINYIVENFLSTGELPKAREGMYGDFTNGTDFHTAMNGVKVAMAGFYELPAHVRSEFENDPGKMLDFIADDRNRSKAVALGLIPPPKSEDLSTAPPERAQHAGVGGAVGKSGRTPKASPRASQSDSEASADDE